MARDQDEDERERSATPEESLAAFARHRENVIEHERLEQEREERRKRQERLRPRTPGALPLDYFSDIETGKPKSWLIKKVIARGEMSSWIGAPGVAKSALLTDLAVQGASSEQWRGYKIPAIFGVVYFALERSALVQRRLLAYRRRDQIELTTPIAVCGRMIDLLNGQCINIVLATVDEAEQRFGKAIGLVVIDTFSKGISAAGGDEDKARDQNKVAAHMRRILERKPLHIAGIGHTGKDESRGERGSNARVADVDLRVVITGERVRTATIDKANDQDEGTLTSFELESVELGQDEDGETITTGIVSPVLSTAQTQPRQTKVKGFPQILQTAVRNAIVQLADEGGTQGHGFDGARVVKIKISDLRDRLVERGILEMEGNRIDATSRQQFRRAKAALIEEQKIVEQNGWVWII